MIDRKRKKPGEVFRIYHEDTPEIDHCSNQTLSIPQLEALATNVVKSIGAGIVFLNGRTESKITLLKRFDKNGVIQ